MMTSLGNPQEVSRKSLGHLHGMMLTPEHHDPLGHHGQREKRDHWKDHNLGDERMVWLLAQLRNTAKLKR